MLALMQNQFLLNWQVCDGLPKLDGVCRFYVPIIKTMDQHHICLDLVSVFPVVARIPPCVVSASCSILIVSDRSKMLFPSLFDVNQVAARLLPGEGIHSQNIRIFTLETTRGHYETIFTVVVIPAGNASVGNNCLETVNPSCGRRHG